MSTKIFKERYEFELNLRNTLNQSIAAPMTITTLLGGAVIFFVHHYSFRWDKLSILFCLLLSILILLLTGSVYAIFRATTGYNYATISASAELKSWRDKLVTKHGGDAVQVNAEFENWLESQYIDTTTTNESNNLSKAKYIRFANRCLACATGIAIFATIPYFVNFAGNPEKPTRVQITNSEFKVMSEKNVPGEPGIPSSPAPSRPPVESPKPRPEPEPTPPPKPRYIPERKAPDESTE